MSGPNVSGAHDEAGTRPAHAVVRKPAKLSRRALFGVGAVAGAGFAQGNPTLSQNRTTRAMLKEGRIDTHHHFLPPEFVAAIGAERLASVTPDKKLPDWSVQRSLDVCGTYGISKAILSVSPGYPPLDAAVERPLMRTCNDIGARIHHDHAGRFGQFASVPMFDRDEALKEIEYSFSALKADGVVVFTNYGGTYLGDASFDEIWQELNRRKAVVFIHPTTPQYSLRGQPPQAVAEFPHDTTRAAISLIYSGATQRYLDISFILSHAGGTLPFLAARIAGGVTFNPEVQARVADPMAEIRRFWFDTALSANPASLSALLAVADPERIIFGSDFPYAPGLALRVNVEGADRFPMDERLRANVVRGNAARLLHRTFPDAG